MERSRLINLLLILLILLASLVLAQMLLQFLSGFADLILLFVLGWLLSFVLNPVVTNLSRHPVPRSLAPFLEARLGKARAIAISRFRFSRQMAVVLVYLAFLIVILILAALVVPIAITQLSQVASRLPEFVSRTPEVTAWAQEQLTRFGIQINVENAVGAGLAGLQGVATATIQNSLTILSSLLSLLADFLLVLILGFLMTLDGPRLRDIIFDNLLPPKYRDEYGFFMQSVKRTFGGFIRGQLIQAALVAIGTAVGMALLNLNFILIASTFAGLFMLIPLIGPFLALLPPFLSSVVQSPELTVWLILALLIYQMIITNVLMPRILSDVLGLHPLLVFAALLFGIRIGGFWGAFFGIPVVGVLWAMALFFFERWQRDHPMHPEQDDEEID